MSWILEFESQSEPHAPAWLRGQCTEAVALAASVLRLSSLCREMGVRELVSFAEYAGEESEWFRPVEVLPVLTMLLVRVAALPQGEVLSSYPSIPEYPREHVIHELVVWLMLVAAAAERGDRLRIVVC